MGTLHVVATPIGHLEDVTLRALRVLGEVDVVYAEDTRRTRVLLDRHGIAARLVSLHAHNEAKRVEEALARLDAGERIALVTDAGTPVVSDPGGRLVAAAAAAGHTVEPLPGPSAVLAALAACGLRVTTFTFLGFPPRRSGARRKRFRAFACGEPALVLFEAPTRVAGTLADLARELGESRPACVARELTKLHEELVRGTLGELAVRFAEGTRGEVTIVVEGADEETVRTADDDLDDAGLDRAIAAMAAEGRRPRAIAAELSSRTDVPRRAIYARAVDVCASLDADDPGVSGS
jgi:16S rRNA (cytidine1402-2'-O)-methyltransferase